MNPSAFAYHAHRRFPGRFARFRGLMEFLLPVVHVLVPGMGPAQVNKYLGGSLNLDNNNIYLVRSMTTPWPAPTWRCSHVSTFLNPLNSSREPRQD
jgi:hypothetical protein